MKHYLLRVAGVNIYSSIKDTEQLSVYRGASLLLKQAIVDFSKLKEKYLVKVKDLIEIISCISTGASEGLFLIKLNDGVSIAKVEKAIKTCLIEHSQYKHFTFVVNSIAYNNSEFKQTKEKLIAKSFFSQIKQSTVALPKWNSDKDISVCPVDKIRPAIINHNIPTGHVCCSDSVSKRFVYGCDQKQKFVQAETGLDNLEFTQTLSEIAVGDKNRYGNLNNKIAVIYFDGNGFGKKQAACRNETELKTFDNAMQDKRKEFLTTFIETINLDPDFKNGDKIRLEILLWGGDEITLVVPAWKGLWTMQFFYQQTENWKYPDNGKQENQLTHAGGIVFSHHKTSIHKLHDLARTLAENVKERDERGKKEKKAGRNNNWFDYLILESIDYPTQSLNDFWKIRYGSKVAKTRIPLKTANSSFEQLVILKKQLPTGQIYRLIANQLENQENNSIRIQQIIRENGLNWQDINNQLNDYFKLETSKKDNFNLWSWIHFLELWDYLPEKEASGRRLNAVL